LAAKRKINPCFSGSRERHGESQPIVLGLFIRELISFGFHYHPNLIPSSALCRVFLGQRRGAIRLEGRAEAALTLMPARFDTTYIGVYKNLNIVIDVHPA
jgi:hypothetical protein